jgi:class 3 adenylate cyclase/predicted negative regulator of RcsB-dependent stress response
MSDTLITLLQQAGVPVSTVEALARLVATPPSGTIDPAEIQSANPVQQALLAAIVAASDIRQFGMGLRGLLTWIDTHQIELTTYDAGRFWHLHGLLAWRLDGVIYPAWRALNRSVALLQEVDTPAARAYLARVFDTCGQLLQHQDLLSEAQIEYELALRLRDPMDEAGIALTEGNLGRLCMERGDFQAAALHLERDLHIVTRIAPKLTRLRAQLLSHLGTCALEGGDLEASRAYFQQSATLAQQDQNALGLTFCALGLGKLALRSTDLPEAQRQITLGHTYLEQASVDPAFKESIQGLLHQLQGEIFLQHQQAPQAIQAFEQALRCLEHTPGTSPVERVHVLYGLARARRLNGDDRQVSLLLRESLRRLDATAVEHLRTTIEAELHRDFHESWLLHAAGRFIGQEHIEFLLEQAGRGGFRGDRQEVTILFSDIRNFTSIAEAMTPEQLITFLNDYLGHMTRCVESYGGMVDKFIGDAVMAVFSLPTTQPDDAERAVLAALLMRVELERFNRKMPSGTPHLAIGVGLHSGPVIAGLIGSPQKRSYTVIGDAVNTASRLENLTKLLGGSILISAEIVQRLPRADRFLLRPLGSYRMKGKETPVEVFDVMGEDDGSRFARTMRSEIAQVQEALGCFQQGALPAAAQHFTALATSLPSSVRARGYHFLATLAAEYQQQPPTPWEGVITMLEK